MDARVKPGHDERGYGGTVVPGRSQDRTPMRNRALGNLEILRGAIAPHSSRYARAGMTAAMARTVYTLPFSASVISSSTLGSSIVAGMAQGS
jgi:hypothetical protein